MARARGIAASITISVNVRNNFPLARRAALGHLNHGLRKCNRASLDSVERGPVCHNRPVIERPGCFRTPQSIKAWLLRQRWEPLSRRAHRPWELRALVPQRAQVAQPQGQRAPVGLAVSPLREPEAWVPARQQVRRELGRPRAEARREPRYRWMPPERTPRSQRLNRDRRMGSRMAKHRAFRTLARTSQPRRVNRVRGSSSCASS